MGNLAKGIKEALPEFQKYLLERGLAPGENVPFIAYWVSRFLSFGRTRAIATEDYNESAVFEFLDMLKSDDKILHWQPRQADEAIKLYYFHYLGQEAPKLGDKLKYNERPAAFEKVKRLIRLRHYSYSTERTYLHWIERFFSYAVTGDKKLSDMTSREFKDFLSHLALKKRVSASTQNQAFNAILFLYRNVLGKETGDLNNTVRAKRGQKLPVVFTVEEVKRLFGHMNGIHRLIAELLYGSGMQEHGKCPEKPA